jgi:uroporphyrinogen decarboxylase
MENVIRKKMNRRERFIMCLNHQEPDRVPIDLGSTGGGITDVAYYRLKELLGLVEDKGTTMTSTLTVSEFDERVLEALDVDIRHIGLKGPSHRPRRVEHSDGSWSDEWGVSYRKVGYYNQFVNPPLRNATLSEIEHYPWPDPGDPGRVQGLAERARHLYENTDYGISALSVASGGLFLLCCRLRGMEQFLMDMIIDKPLAKSLLSGLRRRSSASWKSC